MASEQDAGKVQKKTWAMLLGALALAVAGAYGAWSYLKKAPEQPSQVNLDRVNNSALNKNTETAAYRAQLEQSNRQGAAQAQAEDRSFVASLNLTQQPVTPSPSTQTPPKGSTSNSNTSREADRSAAAADTTKQDERRQQALDRFMERLAKEQTHSGLQTARMLGANGSEGGMGGSGNTGGTADTSYQQWSQSLGGMRTVSAAGNGSAGSGATRSASVVPIEVIPPYWRGPGYIDLGVDSDNSTTPVLGRIGTGTYAGAVLKASDGAKLTGEGVVIHFTEMAYKGINYKVDAYALQEDSLLANVATDVNHRYMSRIVLPALLSGIGGIGEMYSQANTQLVSNGFNSQLVRPGLPDSTAVLGAVAGGAAGQAAKVLTEDAARLPATQVTVTKGQVVAIQFMRGVYSGDAIAPGEGGDAVKAAQPARTASLAPAQPSTDDQWRAAARRQIQAQQSSQELTR